MARNMDFLVCVLIMIMDIIAGILGIQAEVAQNKVRLMLIEHDRFIYVCVSFFFFYFFKKILDRNFHVLVSEIEYLFLCRLNI